VRLLDRLLATKPGGATDQAPAPLAIGFDSRTRGFDPRAIIDQVKRLARRPDLFVTTLFLDCSGAELERRYNETRRRHPLAPESDGLTESIAAERALLLTTRDAADLVIDTSELNIHQLKQRLVAAFDAAGSSQLQVAVESFGFKHGLPLDADIVMDVRFLPNPHWVEELRPLTGHDPDVRDYVLERADTQGFLDHLEALLNGILPSYQAEGRSYLTVAIGCTGGRHRSVAIAEELASRLRSRGTAVRTTHRDVTR